MSTASALLLTLAVAANSDAVLLEFTAEWCGPCRVMEPTVARLTSAGYPVRKIDVDRDAAVATRYRVNGVPCFVMLVNGQEVERITGAVSYDRLLQMYRKPHVRAPRADQLQADQPRAAASRAPSKQARGNIVRGQSPDQAPPARRTPSHTFGSATPAAPGATAMTAGPRTASAATDHSANSSTGINPEAVRAAYQASVRLKVQDPNGHGFGSGTIIDVHGSEALVVTCGHLFRDSAGKGTVQVDLFPDGQPTTVPGQLLSYNLERDIALVSITPGQPVTPVRVAASGKGVARGAPVFSIGCDKGAAPSVRESHVTAIDRYLGPPNIEVAGQPIDGRSGGGLFSNDGRLIGICNAADPADDEGIYAGLPTIHWELDRIGQRRIYAPATPTEVARNGARRAEQPEAFAQQTPPPMPDRMVMPAVTSQVQPREPLPELTGADTEVICIIRSRRDPQGQQRLLVLDQPSADLLARLRQESQAVGGNAAVARQASAPRRRASEPVIRAQSADR